jgi:hypothetical protein
VHARLEIARRKGNDLAPVDLAVASERERLLTYVWADQLERLTRLEAALSLAARNPPRIEAGDAAQWLEGELPRTSGRREARVLMHSIVWGYLASDARARIARHVERCAQSATSASPFAWLAFELDPAHGHATLRLRLWPESTDRVLAVAHPHGTHVDWHA